MLNRIQQGVRSVNLISESGLYKLIMRSDKPPGQGLPGLGHQGSPPEHPEDGLLCDRPAEPPGEPEVGPAGADDGS